MRSLSRTPLIVRAAGLLSICLQIAAFIALLFFLILGFSSARAAPTRVKPTVVLVHGAFADSSSWNGVIQRLLAKGYPVVAVANPLRGVRNDADFTEAVVESIPGSVVLVGHSYAGSVISNVSNSKGNIKALVFVAERGGL